MPRLFNFVRATLSASTFSQYSGTYIIKVCPGTSLGRVPDHPALSVAGDEIRVEQGDILLFRFAALFKVGDGKNGRTFGFSKRNLLSIKTGEGIPIWERVARFACQ